MKKIYFTLTLILTLALSRIDPRPKIAILVKVSSWSLLREFPFGPNNFPTKLNYTEKYTKAEFSLLLLLLF